MLSTKTRRQIFSAKQLMLHRGEVQEHRRMRALDVAGVEVLASLQQERLLSMVRHAFSTTPFYRDLYGAAGLTMKDFSDPEVLSSLPIVNRSDVHDGFEDIRSRSVGSEDVLVKTTGGTTGDPMRILRDRRASELAIVWRMRDWWGLHPGDPLAKVWRYRKPSDSPSRAERAQSWPAARIKLNAGRMDEAEIVRFLDEWDRVRPRLLMGYLGALLEVARYVHESGRRVAPVTAIEATASPLTAADKVLLSTAFGGPVYDLYQSTEVPVMAAECAERDGLHVFSDTCRVEVVDDEGRPTAPGETGTVVVSNLRNWAFPLIRYRQDDRTSWKPDGCRCSRPYPVLDPVRGRFSDDLALPSGRVVIGITMTGIFDPWPGSVRQFQLVQHADRSLTLRCVRGDDPEADAIMRRVVADVAERVDREVPVRLEVVDVIQHDRGKARLILREEGAAPVPFQAGRAALASPPSSAG